MLFGVPTWGSGPHFSVSAPSSSSPSPHTQKGRRRPPRCLPSTSSDRSAEGSDTATPNKHQRVKISSGAQGPPATGRVQALRSLRSDGGLAGWLLRVGRAFLQHRGVGVGRRVGTHKALPGRFPGRRPWVPRPSPDPTSDLLRIQMVPGASHPSASGTGGDRRAAKLDFFSSSATRAPSRDLVNCELDE